MPRLVLSILSAFLIVGCSPDPMEISEPPTVGTVSAVEMQFLEALNAERSRQGMLQVTLDPALSIAAQRHADDMVERGYFNHRSPEGQTHSARIRAAGGRSCSSGETLAFGEASVRSAVASWLSSPDHSAILLRPRFVRAGVGGNGDTWVATVAARC